MVILFPLIIHIYIYASFFKLPYYVFTLNARVLEVVTVSVAVKEGKLQTVRFKER